jgi:hypothetical protein
MKNKRNILLILLVLCLVAFGLSSCGSGGGSGGSVGGSGGLPESSSDTGSVAILITDDPSNDFSAILITITKIELLSDEGKFTVFSGKKTVNLLDLKNETTIFSVEDNVPAIQYNKIRLTAEKMVLVDKELVDHNGDPVTYPVKLPGNNKIDLNPREPFTVTSGEMLAIHLDMDAEKCIHIVEIKKGKKLEKEYRFRSVVFIKIIKDFQLDDLIRASGIVRKIDLSANQFTLCMNDEIDGIDSDDRSANGCCITVSTSRGTSFFAASANGRAVDFEDLMNGDNVTVIGFYQTLFPSIHDMNDSCQMVLDASVVEIGIFSKLKGTIIEELVPADDITSSSSELIYRLDPGQGFGTRTDVDLLIQDETKIYSSLQRAFLDEWTEEDILGKSAEIDGILLLSNSNPDTLVAAFILIDETTASSEKLSGRIDNINYRSRTFDLVLSPSETMCVNVPEDADIFLILKIESSEMIDFINLHDGLTVDLYKEPVDNGSDCFMPETVIAFETG